MAKLEEIKVETKVQIFSWSAFLTLLQEVHPKITF